MTTPIRAHLFGSVGDSGFDPMAAGILRQRSQGTRYAGGEYNHAVFRQEWRTGGLGMMSDAPMAAPVQVHPTLHALYGAWCEDDPENELYPVVADGLTAEELRNFRTFMTLIPSIRRPFAFAFAGPGPAGYTLYLGRNGGPDDTQWYVFEVDGQQYFTTVLGAAETTFGDRLGSVLKVAARVLHAPLTGESFPWP